jgi:hypothetical protein
LFPGAAPFFAQGPEEQGEALEQQVRQEPLVEARLAAGIGRRRRRLDAAQGSILQINVSAENLSDQFMYILNFEQISTKGEPLWLSGKVAKMRK